MPCSSHPDKNASEKQKIEKDQFHFQKKPRGREISRHTAFVTGGGLEALLLFLAIVSVPQKKTLPQQQLLWQLNV
jgi:hypothetical protein